MPEGVFEEYKEGVPEVEYRDCQRECLRSDIRSVQRVSEVVSEKYQSGTKLVFLCFSRHDHFFRHDHFLKSLQQHMRPYTYRMAMYTLVDYLM